MPHSRFRLSKAATKGLIKLKLGIRQAHNKRRGGNYGHRSANDTNSTSQSNGNSELALEPSGTRKRNNPVALSVVQKRSSTCQRHWRFFPGECSPRGG